MGTPKSWVVSVKNNRILTYVVFHYFLSGLEFAGIWCLQVCGEHEVGYCEVQGEVLYCWCQRLGALISSCNEKRKFFLENTIYVQHPKRKYSR